MFIGITLNYAAFIGFEMFSTEMFKFLLLLASRNFCTLSKALITCMSTWHSTDKRRMSIISYLKNSSGR